MSLINLNKFRILELVSLNLNCIQLADLVLVLIEFLLLHIFLDRKKVSSFFLGFYSLLLRPVSVPTKNENKSSLESRSSSSTEQETEDINDDRSICGRDVEMVLKSLRIYREGEDNVVPDKLDAADILDIFEAKSASLDEVRQAFEVFDENMDGFIDAKELQKVLCALGLNEGLEMENCRRMIGAFDEDGDGKIDFDEFVKLFMENGF